LKQVCSRKKGGREATRHLSRVGDSLLGGGDVAAGAALSLVALKVTLTSVLGKTRVDGLALSAGLEAVKASAGVLPMGLAVVSQLGRGLALDGLTEALVDLGRGGTTNSVGGLAALGDVLGVVVRLEGAVKRLV